MFEMFAALLAVIGIVAGLWGRAETKRKKAERELDALKWRRDADREVKGWTDADLIDRISRRRDRRDR